MGLKRTIKQAIMVHSLKKKNKKEPFIAEIAEHYQLPKDASKLDTNSYYFSSHDLEGNSVFMRRAERGDQTVEIWFAYKTKDAIYTNKQQLFNMADAPIAVSCLETAKSWQATFKGDVYKAEIGKHGIAQVKGNKIKANMTLSFEATSDIFDFTYHLNPRIMANVLANETWDKTFQKNMKANQQRHYEQLGKGQITLDLGGQKETLNMTTMRDHSFGRRDWNYMDRHIWLMALLNENESLNVNMVSYPHMKGLKTGYYENNHQTANIEVFPSLDKFEANGYVPKELKYDMILENGHAFHVEAIKEIEIQFSFDGGNYTICEGVGSFDINGYPARGIIEFGFNKDKSRW